MNEKLDPVVRSEQWNAEYIARGQDIVKLQRQIAAARKWYDEEYPAEDGHDQVYPWDYA